MRRRLKRFMSLLFVTLLMIPPGLIPTVAKAETNDGILPSEEIILFQNFEDGEIGEWESLSWGSEGTVVISSDVASDGEHSLQYKDRADRESSPSINLTNLIESGKKYDISFKVKVGEGEDTLHLASKVDSPDLDNKYPWLIGNHSVNSDEWTLFELKDYEVPGDTAEFIIWIEADDKENADKPKADIFIDEVLIKDVSPPTPPTEKSILYQSFEDGENGGWEKLSWGDNGVVVVSSDFASDGTKSLLFKDRLSGNSSPSLDLTNILESGKTYDISLKVRVSEGEDVLRLTAKIDSPEVDNQYPWLVGNTTVDSNGWSVFEHKDFTVPTNTSELIIWLEADESGNADLPDIYIDEVLIVEVSSGGEEEPIEPEEPRAPAEEFTTIDFENGELSGFEARGDDEKLTLTDEANHTDGGSYALKIEDRAKAWNGPSLSVEKYIDLGQEYKISAWVKLISPESSQLQLSTQIGSEDHGASYNNIQGKTINAADGWVQLEGTYRYTSVGDEFVTIYVESSNNATASFYIDDITFEPTGSGVVDIEKDLTPLKDVYKDDFLIGNAVSAADFDGSRLELLKLHHNLVTAENAMKPSYAYNDEGEFDFTAEDALVERALAEELKIHGHVLVWHQQSNESLHTDNDGNPLSREEALNNLRVHIETVVKHFGDKVISWDVVNEAMNDNPPNPTDWEGALRQSGWLKAIGPDYLEQSFRMAKEVIDENGWDIKLFYNDYNDDNQSKATAIEHMVKEINDNYAKDHPGELLIDGIGMQGHYNLNTNPENVRRSLEKFIDIGVEVGVTELDITAGGDSVLTEKEANQQAYLYAQLFQIYKEHAEHISRVTFWGLNDASSWRGDRNPLLFDHNMQAKPAYYALLDPDKFIAEYDPDEVEAREGESLFGTPTIDGEIDDIWKDAQKLPVDRAQQAWDVANGEAKVLWDDDNLYVLVQVSDSKLDKTGADAHEQDSVEVFIDENNAKTSFYEDDDGQYRVNFDNETSFNPAGIAEGFESATVKSDNGYTVEMKIPFKKIEPVDGLKIGFDVQINDAENGSRQGVSIWNDLSGVGYQDTSVFGNLTLVKSEGEKDPDPDPDPEKPDPKPEKPSKPIVTKPIVIDKEATVKDEDVKKVNKDGEFVVDLSDNDASIKVSLTADQIKMLKEQNATIIVKKKDVEIQIPASILVNGNEAVEIIIERMKDIEGALSTVYDFKILQGGTEIKDFGTHVTLTFEVNQEKVKNPENVKVFYWNPDTEEWELVGGTYADGYISVDVDHFSIFAVFETEPGEIPETVVPELNETPETVVPESEEDPETVTPEIEDGQKLPKTATHTFNWLMIGFAMLVLGTSFIFVNRRKKA